MAQEWNGFGIRDLCYRVLSFLFCHCGNPCKWKWCEFVLLWGPPKSNISQTPGQWRGRKCIVISCHWSIRATEHSWELDCDHQEKGHSIFKGWDHRVGWDVGCSIVQSYFDIRGWSREFSPIRIGAESWAWGHERVWHCQQDGVVLEWHLVPYNRCCSALGKSPAPRVPRTLNLISPHD